MKYVLALIVTALLAACGKPSIVGTFVTSTSKTSFTFTADGKVRAAGKETTYTVDGDLIKFHFEDAVPAAFTQNSDGSISWAGQRYIKQ